jgi:cysteine desulfurase/selenocysteine lyase
VNYLNHASIGTMPQALSGLRTELLEQCETNPWLYMWGGAWEEPRELARASAARLLGADPSDVAITHNTTEGFNLLAQGLPLGAGDEVLFSNMNHAGASVCWEQQAARRGFSVRRFEFPLLDAASLTAADVAEIYLREIRDNTRVLVFPHVDNIVGFRYPLEELAAGAHARGVEFVAVDGAQTAGMIPFDIESTGVDFYSTSGHKWIQAPKGTGLLYLRPASREGLEPMWTTWGQARWADTARRYEDYGTRNLAEAVVLGTAADYQLALGDRRFERLNYLRRYAKNAVDASAKLRWCSPVRWEDGASLFAVRVAGVNAGDASQRLYADSGVVLRPFGGDLNTMRLSPNVITSTDQIDAFVRLVEAL